MLYIWEYYHINFLFITESKAVKMSNNQAIENNKENLDFLKYCISYIEKRIGLIDNKANIFIAVLTILFAAISYSIDNYFFKEINTHNFYYYFTYIVLIVAFLIFIVVILLLMATIRPTKNIFSFRVPFKHMKVENYVMWFDDCFPCEPNEYNRRMDNIDKYQEYNLRKTHYYALTLIKRKYKYYRYAIFLMKILVLLFFIGILMMPIWRFTQSN